MSPSDNKIEAMKHTKRPNIVKQTLTAKVPYAISFRSSEPLIQFAAPKDRGISGCFYNIVALKTLRTKLRKKTRPKPCLQHVHLLHDRAPAYKSSTVAKILSL